MGSIYDLLRGVYASHTINLLRLAAGTQAAIVEILGRMVSELVTKLTTADLTEIQRTRFKSLVSEANGIIGGYYILAAEKLDSTLTGLAALEAKFSRSTIKDLLTVDLLKIMPPANVLEKLATTANVLGAPTKAWWEKQAADTAFKYVAEVQQGIAASETNSQIVSRVWNRTGSGLLNKVDANAETLVRSSVQTVANQARVATFEANPDVVNGTIWLSTLDDRTSLICIARSGLKWDLEHEPVGHDLPYTEPPAHWGCRSSMVPWLKTFKELGLDIDEMPASTRASLDGPVASDMTFADWLDKQSTERQDELLGVGRAGLWRRGTISLNQLLDQRGRPLSLSALAEKYGH